jgi:ParB-like chromosome segregation protein Spo0J
MMAEVKGKAQQLPTDKVQITDELRAVADLKGDPKNARRHSERQVAQIAGSIERFGYVNKIVVRPSGIVVGGHATLEAIKRLGRDKIEVRVVNGLTEAQYQALALALNRLPENSSWDDNILGEVLGELQDEGEELTGLGFGDREIASLLKGADDIEVKEIETGDVDDEFWISIRGPLASQAETLKRLEDALKPVAGVSVELGTISLG